MAEMARRQRPSRGESWREDTSRRRPCPLSFDKLKQTSYRQDTDKLMRQPATVRQLESVRHRKATAQDFRSTHRRMASLKRAREEPSARVARTKELGGTDLAAVRL